MENIIKAQAICIKAIDFGEADKLATLCVFGKGKILIKARGCKKAKAKLKFAASPMCFGEYCLAVRGKNHTLVGCDTYDTFYDISCDIEKFYCAMTVLETLDFFMKEANEDDKLLFFAVSALKSIAYELIASPKVVLAKFLISALKTEGYAANFDVCCRCGKTLDEKACLVGFEYGISCLSCFDNLNHLDKRFLENYRRIQNLDLSMLGDIGDLQVRRILAVLQSFVEECCDEKLKALAQLLINF